VPRTGVKPLGARVGFLVRQGGSGAWLALVREDGTVSRHLIPDGAASVQLPPLPYGRHRLLVDDRPECACHLIVVPPRCHLPEALAGGARRFGIAAHLYTLRRAGDQGIGDFTTLAELAAEAARAGAAIIGLNPLHALFANDRERTSPYQPSDRRFLDPIYLDVPEAAGAASESGMVDYPAVWRAKRRALEVRFERDGTDDPDFAAFLEAGGDPLRQFATFEALAETLGSTAWRDWPPGLRHPRDTGVDEFAARHDSAIRFSCFLQYLADKQLGQAAESAANAGLGLGFYRDLAVGAAPDGAEAWGRQDALMTGVSVGAPPDPFAAQGQVWCLPPPDPLAMAREGYAGFGDLLSANMRHAGALRIDHVMALRRLFLVPDGASAADGAYISYPFEDLLGVTALESHRARCMVVGEALGTVPEGMPRALADANVLSYSVLWFERDGTSIRAPGQWPMLAAACVSTHDLPTLAGWWAGADIAEHVALGLMDRDAERIARTGRERKKASLIAMLVEQRLLGQPYGGGEALSPAVAAAVHALIARTPALLTLVQADDLAGELIGVNLPGTDRERPNWRRRLGRTVAELFHDPAAAAILAASVRR
jgi:4-alpha-glucanotransferase